MSFFADLVDNIGTGLNLPDLGYSEALNGNKASVNTGRVAFTDTGGAFNTASSPSASIINNAYAAKQASAPQATGSGTTATGSAQSYDPYAAANASAAAATAANNSYYNTQAQSAQDQYAALDGSLNTGLSNLQNQYNTGLNTLNDNNAIAQRTYNNQNAQNTQNYLTTKNNIQTTTRANANSLQRLLGLNGAGNSSAASEAAPYAAALLGSQNLNGANTQYSQNQSNLDTNWADTQRQFKQKLSDLDQNLFAGKQGLQSQIAQSRINLLNQISGYKTQAGDASGNAARANQVKDLLSSLASYANQYASPVAVNTDLNYASPTLGSYTLGDQAVASNGQSGAMSDIATPFLSLLTQKKDIYGNPVAA